MILPINTNESDFALMNEKKYSNFSISSLKNKTEILVYSFSVSYALSILMKWQGP